MTLSNFNQRWTADRLLCLIIPCLFFATPISSSAKSILMGLTVGLVFLSHECRTTLSHLLKNRWLRATLLLFFLALIGCLWSPASLSEKALIVEKWSKLLTLPILVAAFQKPQSRQWALHGFLLAMLLTCVIALVMLTTNHFHVSAKVTPDGVFRNHIMTSMMMSFAAYISLWFFIHTHSKQRYVYALLSGLFSYHILFINQSRSGYVFFVLLMLALIVQVFKKRQAIIALFSFSILFTGCLLMSPKLQECIKQAVHNVQHYHQNKNTSVGFRIQFHQFARELFEKNPYVGHGTASFTHLFDIENPVPAWKYDGGHSGRLLEPHSLYWLVAAEWGILGLSLLSWLFAEFLLLCLRLEKMRPFAIGLFIIFVIGNTSDSLLFYSGSGYFFLLFFALCFSELTSSKPALATTHSTPSIHHALT